MSEKTPWEHHPDLSEDRLEIISDILRKVRNEEVALNDINQAIWGYGCLIYDLTRNKLIEESKNYEWLNIVNSSLGFVFSIGEVPVRFYKGSVEDPNDRTLAYNKDEAKQLEFAFGSSTSLEVEHWRFSIETDHDASVLQVSLVGFNSNGKADCIWEFEPDILKHIEDITHSNSNNNKSTPQQKPAIATPKKIKPDEKSIQSKSS